MRFAGFTDATRRAVALRASPAEPLDDPDDDVLWIHELIGSTVVDAARRRHVVTAVESNPASDLLVLEDGGLVPLTFVVDAERGPHHRRRARRPLRLSAVRIDVFTIFPGMVSAFAGESLVGQGRRRRAPRRCGSTTCGTPPPTCTAPSTTPPSAAAPGWCSWPEPVFAAVEAADPPRPLLLLGPAGRRLDQA